MSKLFSYLLFFVLISFTLGCGLDSTTVESNNTTTTDGFSITDETTTESNTTASSFNTNENGITSSQTTTQDDSTTETSETTTTSVTTTSTTTTTATTTEVSSTTTTTIESTTTTTTTTEEIVTIFFDSGLGSSINSISGVEGSQISAPNDPVLEGYEFAGWYIDSGLTQQYQFTTMPGSDITLYAKWLEVITPTSALLTVLVEYDFVCTSSQCVYEVSSGYNYIYDLVEKEFIYDKDIEENESGGHRILESRITIDANWSVSYTYDLDENYGVQITTKLNLSGNALTESYNVTYFSSNTHTESSREEDAIQEIGYFVMFINSILNAAEITMDDLK
jgi:uncharacterized repeat protein (TIGR02543 family)